MAKEKQDKRVKMIECGCGCGETLNKYDGHYRTRTVINGHNNRKYEDPLEYKRAWYHKHKAERHKHLMGLKKKYRNQKKLIMINLNKSKCFHCKIKFDGNNAAIFDFHHVNPEKKSFNLNAKTAQNVALDKMLKELEKCVMLCSNCHRLHHNTDLIPIDKGILDETKNETRSSS